MNRLARVFLEMPVTLWQAGRVFSANRYLVWQLSVRDVAVRYRGSAMGFLWTLVLPLMMLAVYTYMFGVVFQARWPNLLDQDPLRFAPLLFSGLIVHMLFADCLTRAPGIVVGQPNLVKKVVFPLEILSWSVVAGALFHSATSVLVLLGFAFALDKTLPWTVVLIPVVLLSTVPLLMGICWFLSSLGVFLRDIGQIMGVLMTVMLFTAPIFYPMEAAPGALRPYLFLNPLSLVVEEFRKVALLGQLPDWQGLGLYVLVGFAVATFGHYWFRRTHRAFADVL